MGGGGVKMPTVQVAVRVDSKQNELFRSLTKELGTTPAEALRMFIHAFNAAGGFPYSVRISSRFRPGPFKTEQEALDFSTRMTNRLLQEAEEDEAR